MKRKTRAVYKELEHESTRIAACLCAAVDAVTQATKYAKETKLFSNDNITSVALSLYIRRRDEKRPSSDK